MKQLVLQKKNLVGGVCSGVYIDKNVILTAAHCFPSEEGMTVKQVYVKKLGKSALATVIKRDTKVDLALVYTRLPGTPIMLAPFDPRKGSRCFAIGNPLGIESTVTEGIISKTDLKYADSKVSYLLFSAIVLPGNSGGGLFNANGDLIGIVVMSTSIMGALGASGLGIAVPLGNIREFLK